MWHYFSLKSNKGQSARISGSQICVAVVDVHGRLNGFARVLTDFTFKALIFDLIVAPDQRKTGLGNKLINLIKEHEKLKSVKCFELYCLPELEPFYINHGFTTDVDNIKLMRYANVYKTPKAK
ncbi:GNAT family N-acetyltransferase [Catenovulum sp. 2E275]|uniref:GNAT family N-acetyltransferase n=1 Tax=Catenovulum sp. 2E275 TaxID=2980497 RepID=UPI0021D2FE2E|nr:GNAT family N-acetyltransferase [Catenovulum sp. 2E275]MCU4676567.1 GNAT family N-acetyltransferase [Catenovulum sp. 2E275]